MSTLQLPVTYQQIKAGNQSATRFMNIGSGSHLPRSVLGQQSRVANVVPHHRPHAVAQ